MHYQAWVTINTDYYNKRCHHWINLREPSLRYVNQIFWPLRIEQIFLSINREIFIEYGDKPPLPIKIKLFKLKLCSYMIETRRKYNPSKYLSLKYAYNGFSLVRSHTLHAKITKYSLEVSCLRHFWLGYITPMLEAIC